MPPVPPSQHILFSLPKPLYTAIVFFKLSNTLTKLNQCLIYAPSRRQRQCLAPTPSLQHPHLCDPPHTFFIDGRGLSPFSLPSLSACYRCLPPLNVGVSKIEICDHSNTKMSTPLPTTKVTDETNDLTYTPERLEFESSTTCSTLGRFELCTPGNSLWMAHRYGT